MLPDLPVAEALPALLAALRGGSNAVLVAPPGAGKTTLVPLVLRDEPWAAEGKILVLEPRRVAARAAARHRRASAPPAPGASSRALPQTQPRTTRAMWMRMAAAVADRRS